MSALGASAASPSAWARSKAVGEENIREVRDAAARSRRSHPHPRHATPNALGSCTAAAQAFPDTTILRCAPIFGDEDRLLNRMAKLSRAMPVLPLVDGDAKQQPVFADDVAQAVVKAVVDPACAGQTYSLCGPKAYTNKELAEYVFKARACPRASRSHPHRAHRHRALRLPTSNAPCTLPRVRR